MRYFDTREEWLATLVSHLRLTFADAGIALPREVAISVGFPKSHGRSSGAQVIGQCFHPDVSRKHRPEIFVHPMIDDPEWVAAIVAHELIHASGEWDHAKGFATKGQSIGLVGPWTATTAGEDLSVFLKGLIAHIGPYPHGSVGGWDGGPQAPAPKPGGPLPRAPKGPHGVPRTGPAPGSRLIKVTCQHGPDGPCGYTVRVTRKWLAVGAPICPVHALPMSETGTDGATEPGEPEGE